MAEVIGSAAYQLILDSTKFEKGAKLTRQESQALRRTLRDIETPAEKHQKKLDQLASLYRKGKLDAEQLRKGIDKLEKEYEQLNDATDETIRNSKQVNKSAKSNEHAFDSMKTSAAGVAGAMAGVATAMAMAEKATSTFFEQADKMSEWNKRAEMIGVGTEAITSLSYAAERFAHVSSDVFIDSLKEVRLRISDATIGAGQAVDALERLGLSAEELKRMSPEESFLRVADAIRQVQNSADQIRMTDELFGDAGVQLLPMLKQGKRGIVELQEEAVALGVAFGDDAVAGIEKMNSELAKAKAVTEGIKNSLTIGISGPFSEAVGRANKMAGGGDADVVKGAGSAYFRYLNPLGMMNEAVSRGQTAKGWVKELFGVSPVDEELNKRQEARTQAVRLQEWKNKQQQDMDEFLAGFTDPLVTFDNTAAADNIASFFTFAGDKLTEGLNAAKETADALQAKQWDAFDEARWEQKAKEEKAEDEAQKKEAAARLKADEDARKRVEGATMGGVLQDSAEAFRLRREMNKKEDVQNVRLVPEQEDLLKTEVDVGVPIATGGIDINGVV
jgi:hypothetical protein